MKQEIKIPQMGESISEAVIGKILKPTGTWVEENEEIVELETEKVNQVLYAPASGVVSWIAKEEEKFPIGAVIGSVDSEGKAPPKKEPQKEPAKPISKKEPEKAGERVMAEDFIKELKQPKTPSTPPPVSVPSPSPKKKEEESRQKMSTMRQTIAHRLVEALHTTAMLTTYNEADMSAIIELRTKYQESFQKLHNVKLGFMSFFVKAVVEGLKVFPGLNSYIDGDELVTRHYYNIGIAVGTEKGLVVPVVRNCDQLSFVGIEKQIAEYAQKARASKLSIEDLRGGGFTITNGGVYGSLLSSPILNPPQAGILGMHNIVKRPVAIDDAVVIRPMMYLALSYDHRIVDGKQAVSFLVKLKEVLEDPARLLFLESDGKI